MTTFHYGRPNKKSVYDIIDNFNSKKINSIRTSTVPLLSYWKSMSKRISKYRRRLNINLSSPKICFEYPTNSYANNMPSYTDVCLFDDKKAIFIEAKFKELLYTNIRGWYTGSNNRKKVLEHWLNRINGYLKNNIQINEIKEFDYQMLHRISSGCDKNFNRANIIYQIFVDNNFNNEAIYRKELNKYKKLFSKKGYNKTINLYLQRTEVELKNDLKDGKILKNLQRKILYKIIDDKIISI